jgi:formylglycine-generating enzyme required for sulfatase activity
MIDKARSAGVGGLSYSFFSTTANKPAAGITWWQAAKFVNWLNTSTGGQEAYKFGSSGYIELWSQTESGYNPNNLFRNSNAKYFLPSTDEWYKAAYGSPSGTWYNYPTGSDTAPTKVSGGTDGNSAVYGGGLNGAGFGLADINNAGGLSAWGTMAQGGNVAEWNETAFDGINDTASESRVVRGNSFFYSDEAGLDSSHQGGGSPYTPPGYDWGFRVASTASVPEPSCPSLLVLGGVLMALGRRRR